MPRTRGLALALSLWIALTTIQTARADHRPHAGMLRYPDVGRTHIVFLYANHLWLVARDGGVATPLASPPGAAAFPRFSPDGKTIAFVANYDGNDDLYTIPTEGGVPTRVTHHPASEMLCDWTPDGRLLFAARGYTSIMRQTHLFVVPATGGLPEELPVPYGAVAAISPDGIWLAYTPYSTDTRTWKRYVGGMASDIWLFNLRTHASKKITDWEGTDSQPMWQGQTIYYMSDGGPEHRLNIWFYDPQTGRREQVTHFTDFDVKWPAIGPGPDGSGEIVFQYGPDLCLLDLKTRKSRTVEVVVPGDRPNIRTQRVDAAKNIDNFDISATGKRGVFEARGDIWTVPAHKGTPRNLTRSSGVAERDPAWSPDGRWIAYLSDQTGEYELYVCQSDGKGEARQLTGLSGATSEPVETDATKSEEPPHVFRYGPIWSPDSKQIAFTDRRGAVYITTVESGQTRLVDRDPWGNPPQINWSNDSGWLAYTRGGENMQTAIWFCHLATDEKHQVTAGVFRDQEPTFDRDGTYMYFASSRHFKDPIYEDVGNSFAYANTEVLVAVPLRADVGSPWAPRSDEETWKEPASKEEPSTQPAQEEDEEEGAETETEAPGGLLIGGAEQATAPAASGDAAPTEPEGKHEGKKKDKHEKKKEKAEAKPLKIDLAGFEQRALNLPVKPGSFDNLAVTAEGKLVYVRHARPGSGDKPAICIFDPKEEADQADTGDGEEGDEEALGRPATDSGWDAPHAIARSGAFEPPESEKGEKTVVAGVGAFRLSGDGKKLLVHKDSTYAVVEAKPDQKLDKPMALDTLVADVNPREEWHQLFAEAWRIERDFFYDPHMHGVDWPAQREHYAKMLDDCVSRVDVGFVIRELISELNVGHAYYFGDDLADAPHVDVGLLGVDFALHDGAYQLTKIYAGGPWDVDARGPFSHPSALAEGRRPPPPKKDEQPPATYQVHEGDYLLAVNGVPLDTAQDPWAAFQGLAGKVVTLTVSRVPRPATTGPATTEPVNAPADDVGPHEVAVKLLTSDEEAALRYRAWVEQNRVYVDQHSGGQVGYIHVPDTGITGQNELFRQFYGQRDKPALIIDERWNGGGQLPHRFIELLNRPLTNFWARRDSLPEPSPDDAHHGPKCMLINGLAGSGGDMFPFLFRDAKLGKLIGMRTWGGLVGLGGNPRLIDGATVTAPNFAFYKTNGTWGIEGYGVAPDIEVIDDPALMVDGADPQLDKAIECMQSEIERHAYTPVPIPPYPDRTGMGVREEEK